MTTSLYGEPSASAVPLFHDANPEDLGCGSLAYDKQIVSYAFGLLDGLRWDKENAIDVLQRLQETAERRLNQLRERK